MTRHWKIGAIITITVSLASLAFYFYDRAAKADPDNFQDWPPTPAEIRAAVQQAEVAPGQDADKVKRDLFARLFQGRYRSHTPMKAIGLRFLDANRIKLMCEARMEPWNINRLAVAAWEEAHAVLGRRFDLDIYETYIGAPPVKIGELRAIPDRPGVARIIYRYPTSRRGRTASSLTDDSVMPPLITTQSRSPQR